MTKHISIDESEPIAKKLLLAAERLEHRYPELKTFNNALASVRPRYSARLKLVPDTVEHRRHSIIGGTPFISRAYPVPTTTMHGWNSGPEAYLAPLVQLDLDDISNVVGEDFGSGLLQVWMPPGIWGQIPSIGDHYVRVIPRRSVASTQILLDHPDQSDEEWEMKKEAELDVLRLIDPRRAQDDLDVYQHHYWGGNAGFDWTLSRFAEPDAADRIGRGGVVPQRIVGWQKAGYAIPTCSSEGSLWDIPENDDVWFHDKYPELRDDVDYKFVCETVNSYCEQPLCSLFDSTDDFYASIYGMELYYNEESTDWPWRSFFFFPGPLSEAVSDEHVIFYKRTEEGVEFAGACMRWNWH